MSYIVVYQGKEFETSNYDFLYGVAIVKVLLNNNINLYKDDHSPMLVNPDYSLFKESLDYSNNANTNKSYTVIWSGEQRYVTYYSSLDVLFGFKAACELVGICYDNVVYYSHLII